MSDVELKVPCQNCGKTVVMAVAQEALAEWNSGNSRHVQHVFPNLTAAEREMFISGICGACWNKLFPPEPMTVDEFTEFNRG